MIDTRSTLKGDPVEDSAPRKRSHVRRIRSPLRLPGTNYKRPPLGYIHVDTALDMLGIKQCPDDWERVKRTRGFPFRYQRWRRSFFRYRLTRVHGQTLLKRERVIPPRLSVSRRMRLAHRSFKSVRDQLLKAVEVERVVSLFMTEKDGKMITPWPGVWVAQMHAIFYTGIVILGAHERGQRCRVLLQTESFERWLNGEIAPSVGDGTDPSSPRRPVTLSTLKGVLPLVAEQAVANNYRLTQDWLREVMIEAAQNLGRTLSKKEFDSEVWANAALKASRIKHGAPTKAQRLSRDAGRQEMIRTVQDWIASPKKSLRPPHIEREKEPSPQTGSPELSADP